MENLYNPLQGEPGLLNLRDKVRPPAIYNPLQGDLNLQALQDTAQPPQMYNPLQGDPGLQPGLVDPMEEEKKSALRQFIEQRQAGDVEALPATEEDPKKSAIREWFEQKQTENAARDPLEKSTDRSLLFNEIMRGTSDIGEVLRTGIGGKGERAKVGSQDAYFDALRARIQSPLQERKARESEQAKLSDKNDSGKAIDHKEELRQRQHLIEGFNYTSKALQQPAAITKARSKVAATGSLIDGMNDLKILVDKKQGDTGFINPLSEEGRIVEQRLMALFGDLKDYLELGVLQKADEELMRKMIPDAASLKEVFLEGKAGPLLSDMQKVWARGAIGKLKGQGWKVSDWPYQEYAKDKKTTTSSKGVSDMISVISPSGKKGKIPRKNLKKAMDAGYREIK